MTLKLIRDLDTGNETFGRLYCDDFFLCFTIENPWKNNQFGESCIPPGIYPIIFKKYGRFWDKFSLPIPLLKNTEPRTEILIHPANRSSELLGCIAVGDSKGEDCVLNSRKTWFKILPIIKQCSKIHIEMM